MRQREELLVLLARVFAAAPNVGLDTLLDLLVGKHLVVDASNQRVDGKEHADALLVVSVGRVLARRDGLREDWMNKRNPINQERQ